MTKPTPTEKGFIGEGRAAESHASEARIAKVSYRVESRGTKVGMVTELCFIKVDSIDERTAPEVGVPFEPSLPKLCWLCKGRFRKRDLC